MGYERQNPSIPEIARISGLKQADVKRVFSAMILLLRKSGEIRIPRFGKFTVRDFKARTLILNNEEVPVGDRKILHFNSSPVANKALTMRRHGT
jgi:nucleoid DNA-binding protein